MSHSLALVLPSILLSCSGGGDDGRQPLQETEYGTLRLSDETRVPEEMDGIEQITVEADRLVLTFDGDASMVDIPDDAVLVGSTAGGFLRRATDIAAADRTLTIQTSHATLDDAIAEANLDIPLDLSGEWEVELAPDGAGGVAPPPAEFSLDPWNLDLSGTRLVLSDDQGMASLRARSGGLTVQPSGRLIIDKDDDHSRYEAVVRADSQLSLDVVATVDVRTRVREEAELYVLKKHFLTAVGWLPVAGEASLEIKAVAEAQATGGIDLAWTVTGDGAMEAGVVGDGDTWDGVADASFDAQADLASFEVDASGRAFFGVRSKLGLRLYMLAGPYAQLDSGATLAVCSPGGGDVKLGSSARAGFDAKFFGDHRLDVWTWTGDTGTVAEYWREGYFVDADGDGFGDAERAFDACTEGLSWVDNADDCDDADAAVHASGPACSEDCAESLYLYDQGDVDAAAGVRCVTGEFFLGGDAITDLTPLAELETVDGTAHISVGGSGGLTGLREVTGDLALGGLRRSSPNGLFPALETVGGSVTIWSSDELTTLDGFPALTRVGEDLRAWSNPNLTSLSGFSALTTVGGRIDIYGNDALSSAGGFSALSCPGEQLAVRSNPSLSTCGLCGWLEQWSHCDTRYDNAVDECYWCACSWDPRWTEPDSGSTWTRGECLDAYGY